MLKNLSVILVGLILGIVFGLIITLLVPTSTNSVRTVNLKQTIQPANKEVIGFMPYWFISKARDSYKGKITTLSYFSLTISEDGTIEKYSAPGESEPGYISLTSGNADTILSSAKADNIKLSLSVFSGDNDTINTLISDPIKNADNFIEDVMPIMNHYGFTDLNIDIEPTGYYSPESQINYQNFVAEVKKQLTSKASQITLSMDIIPVDFVRNDHLVVPSNVVKYLDKVIIMAYDYHSPSSFVTGAVSPLYGAGNISEFDANTAVNKALEITTKDKIILGIPFYGYSWETIDNFEHAAIIPASVVIIPSDKPCDKCTFQIDAKAAEKYTIYKDEDTGTYHQMFLPDSFSTQAKANYVDENSLGGLAIWALGYDSDSIWSPLQSFLNHH